MSCGNTCTNRTESLDLEVTWSEPPGTRADHASPEEVRVVDDFGFACRLSSRCRSFPSADLRRLARATPTGECHPRTFVFVRWRRQPVRSRARLSSLQLRPESLRCPGLCNFSDTALVPDAIESRPRLNEVGPFQAVVIWASCPVGALHRIIYFTPHVLVGRTLIPAV